MPIKTNILLAPHTYFKLGGPADYFIEAKTTQELIRAVHSAIKQKLPYLILGSGSNVLISDQGYRGMVIKNKATNILLKGFAGGVAKGKIDLKEAIVQADSGVPANQLIRYTLDQGLSGLEDFFGLPGTIGGAIYNNSHHLDQLIGDRVVEVQILDQSGKIKKYTQQECQFAYDYSIFHKTKETILSVSFLLKQGDKTQLWELANAAVKRRSTTQPLGLPSSGCIFKNLALSDQLRLGLPTQSVGYLIDRAGLKGARIGGASVSDVHANFIVNDGTATCQNVLDLIAKIKSIIKAKYAVNLELEVVVI